MIAAIRRANNTVQALIFGLGAFTVWAVNDVGTKFVGKMDVSFLQMVSLISIGAVASLVLFTVARGETKKLKPVSMRQLLPLGLIGVLMSLVNVTTFTQLPLTTVYTALFSSPMIIAVLAKFFMKEQLSRRQFVYIALGFLGSLIAVNPLSADLSSGSALGWIVLPFYPLFFSISTLLIRQHGKTETKESIAFFTPAIRLVVFLPIVMMTWQPMTTQQVLILLGTGFLLSTGNLLFNAALSRADSAIVSPLHYSQLILGAIFGYIIFSDVPAWHTYLGSAIIIGSGLAGAHLAYRRHKDVVPVL